MGGRWSRPSPERVRVFSESPVQCRVDVYPKQPIGCNNRRILGRNGCGLAPGPFRDKSDANGTQLNPEIFELKAGIEKPFKIWDNEMISTAQICGFGLIGLQISGILICARIIQISGLKESTISSNGTRDNLEISKLKQGIDKPFEISKLYVISTAQICWFVLISISVGSSSSEIRPDRNLSEFRSKIASRMADLVERGGP